MSFFQCDNPDFPSKQSQPTIPLILRGKKKSTEAKSLSPNVIMKPDPIMTRNNNNQVNNPQVRFNQVPIIHHRQVVPPNIYHPSPTHIRSISVPRQVHFVRGATPIILRSQPNTISRPISVQRPSRPTNLIQAEKSQGNQIRKRLDENLSHVFKSMHERRLSFNGPSGKIDANILIHEPKLQKKLVQQYIQLIYRDYSIPDPLKQYQSPLKPQDTQRLNGQINRVLVQESVATQPNRNRTGKKKSQAIMSNSTNKKAVELKQSFLIEMFSPADNNIENYGQHDRGHSNYTEMSQQQKRRNTQLWRQVREGPRMQPFNKQIKECYRYCFICQQQILQANIEIHERQKCPEFRNLYEMNFSQLRLCLIKKIQRIHHETQSIHTLLFQKDSSKLRNNFVSLQQQSQVFLKAIDTNIGMQKNKNKLISDQFWKLQLKNNFKNVMNCYQTQYFKMFEYCRKLQWFVLMLRNLENIYMGKQYEKSQQSNSRQIGKNTRQTQVFQSRRFSLVK